jgi:hypothetical protein
MCKIGCHYPLKCNLLSIQITVNYLLRLKVTTPISVSFVFESNMADQHIFLMMCPRLPPFISSPVQV